jgi:hypothetical protein
MDDFPQQNVSDNYSRSSGEGAAANNTQGHYAANTTVGGESPGPQTRTSDGIELQTMALGEGAYDLAFEASENKGKCSWIETGFMIMGATMGTGVMDLPQACAGLGWVFGVAALIFFAIFSVYAGILLSSVKNRYYNDAVSYADVAAAVVGPRFGKFTKYTICVYWAALLPYYLMVATKAMVLAVPHWNLCFYEWALVLAVALAAPLQLRTLHSLVGSASALMMMMFIRVVCACKSHHQYATPLLQRHAAVLSDVAVIVVLVVALADIVASGRDGIPGRFNQLRSLASVNH